jgi:hypothetical protein
MTLALVTDADGVPGTPIETFRIKDVNTTEPVIYTVTSVNHPRLEANTQYWIIAGAISPTEMTWSNTADSWSANARLEAFREKGHPWSVIADPYVPGVLVLGREINPTVASKSNPERFTCASGQRDLDERF